MNISKLLLYYNTLRYLRLRQLVFNFIRRFSTKSKIVATGNVACHSLGMSTPVACRNKIDNESVCFLNERRSFDYISNWSCLDEPKLWRYNLHYFDFLLDDGASEEIKDSLIDSWIQASANLKVDAWEPYPVSLRLVNWIKYFIVYKNNSVPESWLKSLYQQSQVLFNSIEYHILANHYLKNAKALFFSGAYLNCKNAERYYEKGKKILLQEAEEQILSDGGHYEKSPMYHSILVEDYLDVINLIQSNSLAISEQNVSFLKDKTSMTLNFLNAIVMPDGEIPLFNDAAFDIAPHPDLLFNYAYQLIEYDRDICVSDQAIVSLNESGYYIIKSSNSTCIIDCGSVSPDYQPGHTHCDLLSYEMSVKGERLIVNSGLYDYENSDERAYCRSTKAHNTLEIDAQEQSEIWGQFRVARRAEVISSDLVQTEEGECVFIGSYSPYWAAGRQLVHTRQVKQVNNQWIITDDVSGKGNHSIKSYIHLCPGVNCSEGGEYILFTAKNKLAKVTFSDNVVVSIESGCYYPEFGKKINNTVIVLTWAEALPVKLQYTITVF